MRTVQATTTRAERRADREKASRHDLPGVIRGGALGADQSDRPNVRRCRQLPSGCEIVPAAEIIGTASGAIPGAERPALLSACRSERQSIGAAEHQRQSLSTSAPEAVRHPERVEIIAGNWAASAADQSDGRKKETPEA